MDVWEWRLAVLDGRWLKVGQRITPTGGKSACSSSASGGAAGMGGLDDRVGLIGDAGGAIWWLRHESFFSLELECSLGHDRGLRGGSTVAVAVIVHSGRRRAAA